jgi:hypothetical protein
MQNGKQVMGSKGTGPGQRYMNLPPKEAAKAAQREWNSRGYGEAQGAAVGPPKEYGEVGTTAYNARHVSKRVLIFRLLI